MSSSTTETESGREGDAPPFVRRIGPTPVGAELAVRVDAVMPFFNHGMFVEEAVASIRAQTHPVERIIVVDDGSTDEHSHRVLAALEAAGDIEVIRQTNQGPSAARNRGIEKSHADAILFLDCDDLLTATHVEHALSVLAEAGPSVGFAYPDQQSFGTLDDLGVMPRYNLYALTNGNFCGTACIVDAGVFAAGHFFKEDLRLGHEDWEFFLRLGSVGIEGIDFHGSPMHWRRWGYSRSDGIHSRIGHRADELRSLHPDFFDPVKLVQLKRRWSPALSVLVDSAPRFVSAQTCGDYEVVGLPDSGAPAVRGRWVVALDSGAEGLLDDPTFVERVLRIMASPGAPPHLVLDGTPPDGTRTAWQRIADREDGPADGIVVDGPSYHRWHADSQAKTPASATNGITGLIRSLILASGGTPPRRWTGSVRAPGERRPGVRAEQIDVPLPPPGHPTTEAPPSSPASLRDSISEKVDKALAHEQQARWSAPPIYLPRSGPRRLPQPPPGFASSLDALTARGWDRWVPCLTCRLDLVVDHRGWCALEPVDDSDGAASDLPALKGVRLTLGRMWTRKFPGNTALYQRIDRTTQQPFYTVSDLPQADESNVRLGYVATEALSDTVSLTDQLNAAASAVRWQRVPVILPNVDLPMSGVFLEPSGPGTSLSPAPPPQGRLGPWLCGAGGLGATVYELALTRGRVRYSTHPDDCVAHAELARPGAVAVAELAQVSGRSEGPVLQEVRFVATGGAGYLTGPVVADASTEPGPILGAFAVDPGLGVPLVRLRPGPAGPQGDGNPGHRLAIDWRPLAHRGYVTEGVVGNVWRPDPFQSPLYCWDLVGSDVRRLTLGQRPDDAERWAFRGTLGLGWQPHADGPRLADLWELSRGTSVVYAVDPSEFEPAGFTCQRVVARIALDRRPGSIPLWRTALHDNAPWKFTTCPDEGSDEGYVRQGIIGFLDPAHPHPDLFGGDVAPFSPLPGTGALPAGTVVGPVAFGFPVFRVAHRPGEACRMVLSIPEQLDSVVEEVAGYLPTSRTPEAFTAARPGAPVPSGRP